MINKEVPRLVLVEDDPDILDLEKDALEDEDYLVGSFLRSSEAWQYIQSFHRRVNAIVTDVMMPEIDGFELIALVRILNPEIPFLILSSLGEENEYFNKQYKKFRGDYRIRYLRKPFEIKDFLAETRRISLLGMTAQSAGITKNI